MMVRKYGLTELMIGKNAQNPLAGYGCKDNKK